MERLGLYNQSLALCDKAKTYQPSPVASKQMILTLLLLLLLSARTAAMLLNITMNIQTTMVHDSLFEYCLTRISIFALQFYAPACSTYTTLLACKAFLHYQELAKLPSFTMIQYWFLAETVFYLFFLWYRTYLQKEAIHPLLKTLDERKALFNDVKSEISNAEEYLSGWFHGAKIEDIGRDQLREFLDWVFFDARATATDEDELEDYTQELEKLAGRRFGEGKPLTKALRLTLDPIEMECRSLLWYLVSPDYPMTRFKGLKLTRD